MCKRGLNAFAKTIESSQSPLSAHTNLGRTFCFFQFSGGPMAGLSRDLVGSLTNQYKKTREKRHLGICVKCRFRTACADCGLSETTLSVFIIFLFIFFCLEQVYVSTISHVVVKCCHGSPCSDRAG